MTPASARSSSASSPATWPDSCAVARSPSPTSSGVSRSASAGCRRTSRSRRSATSPSRTPGARRGTSRLRPDPATRVRVDRWPGIAPLHLVLCDIGQVDGSDWDALRSHVPAARARAAAATCRAARARRRSSTSSCSRTTGPRRLRCRSRHSAEPSRSRRRRWPRSVPPASSRSSSCPSTASTSSRFRSHPPTGVAAADRSVVTKEVVREVARRGGRRATFAPLREAGSVGSGAHIHLSLHDEAGRPVSYDPLRPGRLSLVAGRFAAGILDHLPAVLALTCASPHSFARLVPHRWSAAAARACRPQPRGRAAHLSRRRARQA